MYRVAIYTYHHHHPRYKHCTPVEKASNIKHKIKMYKVQRCILYNNPSQYIVHLLHLHFNIVSHISLVSLLPPLVSHSCGLSLSLSHSHSFNVFTCFNCPPCNLSLTTPPPSFSNSSTPRDPSACDICFST